MTAFDWIQTLASVATAIGVGVAAVQLWITKQQEQSQFEERLTTEYRRIVEQLPLDALLNKPLALPIPEGALRAFYEYFDLSNEQVFLAGEKRVRAKTWKNWREGIQQHMQRKAFRQAWDQLKPDLDGSFDELKSLINEYDGG